MTSEALVPPLCAVAGLLAVAGALKVWRPAATAATLAALGLPANPLLVRLLGAAEIAVGAGCLLRPSRPLEVAVAGAYLAFAVVIVVQLRSVAGATSCGCLGAKATPPSRIHVAFNLSAVAVAAASAAIGPPGFVSLAGGDAAGTVVAVVGLVAAIRLSGAIVVELPGCVAAYRGERT